MSRKDKAPNASQTKKPAQEVVDAELDYIGGGVSLSFGKTISPSDRTSPTDKTKQTFSPMGSPTDEIISPTDLPSFSPSDAPKRRR